MSACGVLVLSVPALLAVCLRSFPVLLLAELASLPDPTGSRLYAPLCCVRSAPIHRRAVLPVLVPVVALTVGQSMPPRSIAVLLPVCSGADPLRCRCFPQLSLYRVESNRLPTCRLSCRPSVPECGRCVVADLLWCWLYQSNIKADNRITAIGS